MMIKAICLVAMLAACGKSKDAPPSAAGSAAKTASDEGGRPAGLSAETKATLDSYVTAFEKLGADLGAAAPDCAKGVAAVENNAKELDALDARGAAMRAEMDNVSATNGPAIGEWLAKTYAPRMKGAVEKMGPMMGPCESDPALKTAMEGVMSRYPMMRKKKAP